MEADVHNGSKWMKIGLLLHFWYFEVHGALKCINWLCNIEDHMLSYL
jgi:hypothetical protein